MPAPFCGLGAWLFLLVGSLAGCSGFSPSSRFSILKYSSRKLADDSSSSRGFAVRGAAGHNGGEEQDNLRLLVETLVSRVDALESEVATLKLSRRDALRSELNSL
jgi:hypothetical protein